MRQMQRSELGVGRGGGFFEREEETLGDSWALMPGSSCCRLFPLFREMQGNALSPEKHALSYHHQWPPQNLCFPFYATSLAIVQSLADAYT